jgi:hypothetical protein
MQLPPDRSRGAESSTPRRSSFNYHSLRERSVNAVDMLVIVTAPTPYVAMLMPLSGVGLEAPAVGDCVAPRDVDYARMSATESAGSYRRCSEPGVRIGRLPCAADGEPVDVHKHYGDHEILTGVGSDCAFR